MYNQSNMKKQEILLSIDKRMYRLLLALVVGYFIWFQVIPFFVRVKCGREARDVIEVNETSGSFGAPERSTSNPYLNCLHKFGLE